MEFNFVELLLLLIGVCILLFLSRIDGRMTKLDSQIKGIRYTLEQIAAHVDIPEPPVNDQLRQLINEGNDIKAVKLARETLGFSLLEAKQYIDTLKSEPK